ncbi:MAG: hypothetical protein RLZZ546_1644 [Bacteroidota bacterium]|jgi:glycosyltransferase involved in cell wall biosynthesis
MKTILVTAYAVNPYKGSEDGMGWNFIVQIARFQKVIAITRENNKSAIEKYMAEKPSDNIYSNIDFKYFDLPYWARFWKKGSRGAMLYYILWQKNIVGFIKKNKLCFDISHNLNFHNDWTPSYLYKLKKPFVWGPIGHHSKIPIPYLALYKKSYLFKDQLTWLVKKFFWNLSFPLKQTIKNADVILAMNKSVEKQIPAIQGKYRIFPSVATQDFGKTTKNSDPKSFTIISAGRFVPLKGFDLTILSFSKFLKTIPNGDIQNIKLILVGSGPEKNLLHKLVENEGISQNVQFIEWIERQKLMKLYADSSVFLFPSHEGAGMVVAEALSFGLPVICLDNDGPGEFVNEKCAFTVRKNSLEKTTDDLASKLETLYFDKNLRLKMSQEARFHFENNFDWQIRGVQLKGIYQAL